MAAKSYTIATYAVVMPDACEDVRRRCAAVARRARWIEIDCDAATYDGGTSGLDPAIHLLDSASEDVARYILILNATNFGSGWFDELDVPEGEIASPSVRRDVVGLGGRRAWPIEIRACAVEACERLAARAAIPPRTLDNWLWHRGLTLTEHQMHPHRTRTTAY